MRLGDYANLFVLLNTGLFLAMTLADYAGAIQWTTRSFRRDGFCVANEDTPLLNSHALAFYVDTVAAVVLAFLSRRYGSVRGVKDSALELGACGVFAHGLGHLGLWAGSLPTDGEAMIVELTGMELLRGTAIKLPLLWGFFFALLRTGPYISGRHAAVHAVLHALVLALLVPPKLAFTYVQTALLWVAAAYDMRRPTSTKDRYYDLNAIMITLPIGLVSWAEALGCDEFFGQSTITFKSVGGHVWYDGTIPLSMFAYCAVVLGMRPVADGKKL